MRYFLDILTKFLYSRTPYRIQSPNKKTGQWSSLRNPKDRSKFDNDPEPKPQYYPFKTHKTQIIANVISKGLLYQKISREPVAFESIHLPITTILISQLVNFCSEILLGGPGPAHRKNSQKPNLRTIPKLQEQFLAKQPP